MRFDTKLVYSSDPFYYEDTNLLSTKGTYNDPELIAKLTDSRMPFGIHSKMLLIDLPLKYLSWFSTIVFPKGELGQMMRIVHEIKSGDMKHLFYNIRNLQENHVRDFSEINK